MIIENKHCDTERLENALNDDTARLLGHPIYVELHTLENLRTFMTSHVFAVWDFMSLLKSLQSRITCVQIPWVPGRDSDSIRFINEIVLAEESDEISPGAFLSHYELYLRAMDEIGADTRPVRDFVRMISSGATFENSMRDINVPLSTKEFVYASLEMARAPLHVTAASFFYGREDIIPRMFQRILDEIETQVGSRCDALRLYLNRHIEIDQGSHGPLAKKLVSNLCGQNVALTKEALDAAKSSIRMREQLWDGILNQINLTKSRTDCSAGSDPRAISFSCT